ncbi:MAG: hypothetical protein E6L04_03175 [Thaumarchaeota archaeon]|nr:MAG: hypothetical protein E6L04_03175 [Nitrososphaerota archaeon]TLX87116.1 MAG: hypothetical protein E6K97_09395 [Nitrososphaerota archaeon]
MYKSQLNNKVLFPLFFFSVALILFSSLVIVFPNHATAAGKFTIDPKINIKKLNNPQKLKVVAYSTGQNKTKYLTGKDLKSNTATVSLQFNQKNDLVTAVHRDEYFVCAYNLNPQTNEMKSYSCIEGNLENPSGKNPVNIGSGPVITLSTGPFKTVKGGQNDVIKNPTIVVWIENIAGKKHLKDIKAVAMIKGEFKSKIIDARKMLKKSKDNIIKVPLHFDKKPEIGPIKKGDFLFGCVSANVLKPVEGTECEHRVTQNTGHIHNIVARHD